MNKGQSWNRHGLNRRSTRVVRAVTFVIYGKINNLDLRFWLRAIYDRLDEIPTEFIHDVRNPVSEVFPVPIEVFEAEPFFRLACAEADENVAGIRCSQVG